MKLALALVLSVLVVELVVRLPFASAAGRTAAAARKAIRVMTATRVSDHWKQRAMLGYAAALLRASLTLLALFALVGSVVGGLALVFRIIVPDFVEFLLGWGAMAVMTVAACLWLLLRGRLLHVRLPSR